MRQHRLRIQSACASRRRERRAASYATPARSRSCRCTMPTGLLASVTISAVIFEAIEHFQRLAGERVAADGLRISGHRRRRQRPSSDRARMWRRRSPSVTMPTMLAARRRRCRRSQNPWTTFRPAHPDISVPTGFSGTASPECMRSRVYFSIAPSLPPGCSTLENRSSGSRGPPAARSPAHRRARASSATRWSAPDYAGRPRAPSAGSAQRRRPWLSVDSRSAVIAITGNAEARRHR